MMDGTNRCVNIFIDLKPCKDDIIIEKQLHRLGAAAAQHHNMINNIR